jgi:hypothetical protein
MWTLRWRSAWPEEAPCTAAPRPSSPATGYARSSTRSATCSGCGGRPPSRRHDSGPRRDPGRRSGASARSSSGAERPRLGRSSSEAGSGNTWLLATGAAAAPERGSRCAAVGAPRSAGGRADPSHPTAHLPGEPAPPHQRLLRRLIRHRLFRAGNLRINHVLHRGDRAAPARRPDRACHRRKLAEGTTSLEAVRCLRRRLSNVVYRQLVADAEAGVVVRLFDDE